ncbi:Membrane proteinase PrsW, cleaves anti-sigma factor RsiW, M82 family [Amycolatopsis lurida]|uniref:PrsW family intramembrane metalloprotease n=1 Tax=Amycolatopsis lurida TaxID=31959 RepID=UPI00089BB6A1|nr:PrsW family intramembrane metalloprotease [Amycolatopsis lurida]SED87600.1 Membrane proteinase PrsW, cleaves anti-sigma factor RsiW, M82 family [Amycolatopsis lurida]
MSEPSSPAPGPDRIRRSRSITVLLPVLGLIAVALCGLFVFGTVTEKVGPLAVGIGVLAALVPVAVVVTAFLWVDRWEPEPPKLLLLSFVWGACVATIIALLLNSGAEAVGDLLLGTGVGGKISGLVSAPLVEEAAKAAFILLLWWRRPIEFDGVVDGIVYAGFTAAGFAFTENIYYFGRAFAEHGFGDGTSAGVLAAFFLRGVLSPFTHPLFAVMTGIGLGVAASSKVRSLRILAPIGGYVVAVLLHALWNGAALLGGAKTFLNVYFLIMVPLFIGVFSVVVMQRRREQRIVAAALPMMVDARWIAPSEVTLLASLSGRRSWRKQARKQSGREAAKAVARYQASVTELAFLRRGRKLTDDAKQRQRELLQVLKTSRADAVRLADGAPRG